MYQFLEVVEAVVVVTILVAEVHASLVSRMQFAPRNLRPARGSRPVSCATSSRPGANVTSHVVRTAH